MPKDLVTAEEIHQAVLNRITSRQYPPGGRLPSVRDLADELGANRNTVNKAYQMLAELGLIESLPGGRKGFSVKEITGMEAQSRDSLVEYFYQQALHLVWKGLAAGLSASEVQVQLHHAVTEVYVTDQLKVAFYECNIHDSVEMGEYLRQALDLNLHYGVLDELFEDVEAIGQHYDLIITTFHHLGEVTQAMAAVADKVVGIDTRLTPEIMLKIARLPKPNIGVVSTLQNTSNMLKHTLYSYYPDRVIHALEIDQPEAVAELARRSDHIVATSTCAEQVAHIIGQEPDVVIHFQVDEQSIQFLRRRLHEIKTRKNENLYPLVIPSA